MLHTKKNIATLLMILFLIFSCTIVQGQIRISDCTFLQNSISLNSTTASYYLSSDIDCSTVNPFIPLGSGNTTTFQGILDGRGFKIKNVNISDSSNFIGLFRSVIGGTIKSLTLQDITITSTSADESQYMGALFGYAEDITLEDVHMVTSKQSQNLIQTTSILYYVASIGGKVKDGTLNRVSVTNTTVFAPNSNYVGGVINLGELYFGQLSNKVSSSYLFNHGYPANTTQVIVRGKNNVGGVVGFATGGSISNSGTLRGKVLATTSTIGGFAGWISNTNVDSVFVRPEVQVIADGDFCGGVFGAIFSDNVDVTAFSVSNVYSRASRVECESSVGGFVGEITQYSDTQLNIINTFVASNVTGTSNVYALIGSIKWTLITLERVYFDNRFAQDDIGTGMSCSQLFANVSKNFDSALWGNDRLKIEPAYSLGVCKCASGCPSSPAPTTTSSPSTSSAPTTIAPTVVQTAPTNPTPVDFSGNYNVDGICQAQCCCPKGKIFVSHERNVVTLGIPEVTGKCLYSSSQTVTFSLSTPTSGTGVFNGVSYTMNLVNQKITFTSENCTISLICSSGQCKSATSVASVTSFTLSVVLMISLFITFLFF